MRRTILLTSLILGLVAFGTAFASSARADTVGPITFEPSQGYSLGDINGQNQWMKTGPYDANVASVSSYPAASKYNFGKQALQISNAVTSGSFGDQTFSPGLSEPAGETGKKHFDSSFWIGTALATEQVGLASTISPDDGNGGRMSFLRFEDHSDGVHVVFFDVSNPGPLGTVSNFVGTDIATLSRKKAHEIEFRITFKNGPGNDKVRIYIDGKKEITGTTWENYYRYDPEAAGSGNTVPPTSKMLIRESSVPNAPATLHNGFLVDGLTLSSSNRGHHGHDGHHGHHGGDDH